MGVTGAGLVQGFGRRVTEAGIHLTSLPLGADDVSVLPTWAGRRGNTCISFTSSIGLKTCNGIDPWRNHHSSTITSGYIIVSCKSFEDK